jgi:hypothetical protein
VKGKATKVKQSIQIRTLILIPIPNHRRQGIIMNQEKREKLSHRSSEESPELLWIWQIGLKVDMMTSF